LFLGAGVVKEDEHSTAVDHAAETSRTLGETRGYVSAGDAKAAQEATEHFGRIGGWVRAEPLKVNVKVPVREGGLVLMGPTNGQGRLADTGWADNSHQA
jgi:hypothetical protein